MYLALLWKSPRKELALHVLAAGTPGGVRSHRHAPLPGGAYLVEGNLHRGNKCGFTGHVPCLKSPLSATKLTVSDPGLSPEC